MAERSDITTDWSESPRIIEVAAPSTELTVQDLHDTCRSNTLQPGEADDSLDNMDDDSIIDSAGKEDLGGGVLVGITATLIDGQVAFESRITPTSTGTITTADGVGTRLIDSAATFVTDGVERGATVINFTDKSITEVLEVLSQTELRTRVLRAGTDNDFDLNDEYQIWNIVQCSIDGGNLVAVDAADNDISPVFPTAFTQIVRTASSSATLQEQEDIQYASFNGSVHVDVTSIYAGTSYPNGTPRQPVNNFSDAKAIADERGFERIEIIGDATIPIGIDFTGYTFVGQSAGKSTITVPGGAIVPQTEFYDCTLNGTLDGVNLIERSVIGAVDGFSGFMFNCGISGTLTLAAGEQGNLLSCYSLVAGGGASQTPEVIIGTASLTVRDWNGGIELSGKTDTSPCSVDMSSGQVVIADDNSAGAITLRGVAKWTNESTYAGTTTINNELLDARQLQEVHTLLGLKAGDKVTITPAGVTTEQGSFTITFTGDGVNTTTQERTA